jgi:hypothetical protein
MRTNGHGKPVVALDVDGTLGDYHGHFLRFARGWFGKEFPSSEEINPGLPLHRFMGVELGEYRQCKLAYRQGGQKRTMPAYPGGSDLTRHIQTSGAEVWICTTRPYLRLDNIDPDTREWLRRNIIRYDAVLFDRVDSKGSKYKELAEQAGGRVAAIVDDLPEMVLVAKSLLPAARVFLRDQPYNKHFAEHDGRLHSSLSARMCIDTALRHWRQLNDR